MDSFYATPVWDISEAGVDCAQCGQHLTEEDEAYFDGVDDYFCEKCAAELTAQWEAEAAAYAEAKCKITKPLPKYEPQYEYRCTHEDYENGNKESYTPNSHFCHRRHECTNYEELIKPLDRDRAWDRILYRAVRDKIEELIEEAIDNMADEDDDDGGGARFESGS